MPVLLGYEDIQRTQQEKYVFVSMQTISVCFRGIERTKPK